MNFYGDLPPAQGEPQVCGASAGLAGWDIAVQFKAKATSAKTTKPGSLAFKPRQAALPSSSKPTSAAAPISKGMNVSTATAPTTQTSVAATKIQTPPPPPARQQSPSEFNNNASFDVVDVYDPRIPNEYIAYCEERLERKKAQRMMEDNMRVMEEAERARAELERQRHEAAQRGDIQSLLMSQTEVGGAGQVAPVGRGRGRGLTNLPAWMTQQIAASATAGGDTATQLAPTPATATAPADGQFQDSAANGATAVGVKRKQGGLLNKPSCVLLLKNMVGPGEEDDQLGPETQQECGRYGEVVACTVHSVPAVVEGGGCCPDQERVRTFVHFESQESAVRAFRDMNGRFFGGRQIAASFFDEDRFARGDLAPDAAERAIWS